MISNRKPRLVLISDLWGSKDSEWINNYTSILNHHFDVFFYSSTELAEINIFNMAQDKIHQEFIEAGIEKAVENLLKFETQKIHILAFSVGGTIAWKAALRGLQVQNLFAVSATRLRYETKKPSTKVELFFGDDDSFLPDSKWFEDMRIKKHFITNHDHEMYREKEIAYDICSSIINQLVPSL